MRTNYDFSPLFRSSIGFDHVFDVLQNAARVQSIDNWPPYDIEKTGEDQYRLTMAVAGFSADDLDITKHPNLLVVTAHKAEKPGGTEVLHRGIANRGFERRFQLADYMEVAAANVADGLLTIELVRQVPEAMKPKQIPVQTLAPSSTADEAPQIEQKQAA